LVIREVLTMKSLAEMIVKNSEEKIPIGALLVADELILPQDLDFALEHQRYSKRPIGEILVQIGALKSDELERTLELQNTSRSH
jgi:hypothetical protein